VIIPGTSRGGVLRVEDKTIKAKAITEHTMRVQAPSLQAENRPWCLVVVAGALLGARFELGDAAIIGREGEVDIKLGEPSVSRRHCHVFRKRGGYWVTDLGATNPTRVNGLQVKASPLLEGDLLTIGDLMLKLLGPKSPENAMVAALHDQATKDALTKLPNRRHFRTEMERAFSEVPSGRGLALIVLDVDHFKHINDKFGHPAGDRVLVAVGEVLRQHVGDRELPGRIGGEEFAVLLPNAAREAAMSLAETLRVALQSLRIEEAGEPIPVAASFGVAIAQGWDASADVVYARADAALYEAKRGGRNRVLLAESDAAR
jgi:diguanylate cyclase (GGDEF)-like protein